MISRLGIKTIEEIDPFIDFPLSTKARNASMAILQEIHQGAFRISFAYQPVHIPGTQLATTVSLSPTWIGISFNKGLIDEHLKVFNLKAIDVFSELFPHELLHAQHIAQQSFLSKIIQKGSDGTLVPHDFITDMLKWAEHETVYSRLQTLEMPQQQDLINYKTFFGMQDIDVIDMNKLNYVHNHIYRIYAYSMQVLQKINYSGQTTENKEKMKDALKELLMQEFNKIFDNPFFVVNKILDVFEKIHRKSSLLRKPQSLTAEKKIKASIDILNTISAAVFEILYYIQDQYHNYNPQPFSLKHIMHKPCGN